MSRFFKWYGLMIFLIAAPGFHSLASAAHKVELTPRPNPPETGENIIEISLFDEKGQGLDQAKVEAVFYMPAMGTMPYMEETAVVKPKGDGIYTGIYDLSMGGTWELNVTIEIDGKKEVYRYSITTGIPGITNKNRGRSTPRSTANQDAPVLDIGPDRLQRIGVRFTEVKSQALEKVVRSIGIVEQDETHREELTLRFPGYIVKQFRGRVGDYVKAGQPLFSVYSPELITAQSEFLLAHDFSKSKDTSFHKSAEERLLNLGLTKGDIAQIKKSGNTIRDIVVRAPIAGTILEINAREGAAVNAGQILYVIGDLSKSYIVARVFQQDVSTLAAGQPVEVVIPSTGETYQAKIDLIYPQVEQGAGTANVRVEVGEYIREMRPGAYVDLRFPVNLGSNLVIPSDAILYSGLHKYVFVDRGQGVLEPREIVIGQRSGPLVAIREGLHEGDRVAASGTFLLSSEAQLRSALPKWQSLKPTEATESSNPGMNHEGTKLPLNKPAQ